MAHSSTSRPPAPRGNKQPGRQFGKSGPISSPLALAVLSLGILIAIGSFGVRQAPAIAEAATTTPTTSVNLAAGLQGSPDGTLTVGTANGQAGGQVTVAIALHTGQLAVRSAQINLGYDGAKLTNPVGAKGPALPEGWTFASNSPGAGDLRFISMDLAGNGVPINGDIFLATFTIAPNTPAGEIQVQVTLHDVRNTNNTTLGLSTTQGSVIVNHAPVLASVGNQKVAEGETLSVGLSASDLDGDPLTYHAVGLPAFGTLTDHGNGAATLEFAPGFTDAGDYTATLVVSDGGLEDAETITITVIAVNRPPQADAGPDQSVDSSASVILDGSNSADPDGDAISFAWAQVSGPSVTLSGTSTARPTFVAPRVPQKSSLRFELTVSDGNASHKDTVTVSVAAAEPFPASLTVGSASGASGRTVTLPISVDSQGTPVRSIRVNLAYNGAALIAPAAMKGPSLPGGWTFTSNSPAAGDLRMMALDPAGAGQVLKGEVFMVTFTITGDAPVGPVQVNVSLQEMYDSWNVPLNTAVQGGAVTVFKVFGDANGDDQFNAADVNHLVDWLIGRLPMPAAGTPAFVAADVNGDGTINPADLNLMIDRLLGRITRFPVEP